MSFNRWRGILGDPGAADNAERTSHAGFAVSSDGIATVSNTNRVQNLSSVALLKKLGKVTMSKPRDSGL